MSVERDETLPLQAQEKLFCFDKGLFNRPDFTVEKFIYLNRKRATLDQLHNDLRGFLRHLQNSMIELINDDYADFVNLSSNLAALKESIEKSAWELFDQSTVKINETAEFIDQKTREVAENKENQIAVRNKIMFLTSLERLANCLARRPSDISLKWYLKLIHTVIAMKTWQVRISSVKLKPNSLVAQEICVARAKKLLSDDLVIDLRGGCQFVLPIYTNLALLDELDFAVKFVSHSVVKSVVDVNGKDHISKLNSVFEQIKKNLSFLCLPSDATTFFKAFQATSIFTAEFPRVEEHPNFLNGLRDRFNVVVYVKRLTCNFKEQLLAKVANTRLVWHAFSKDRLHPFDSSDIVLRAISTLFSNDHFLPVVAADFWDFTLYLIDKHNQWIEDCVNAEPTKVVDEISGSVTVKARWPDLVCLMAGTKSFDIQLFNLCVTKVFSRFEDLGTEATPFRQFLCEYTTLMEEKREEIRGKVVSDLSEKAGKKLSQVSEIPKQYRWTKKPMPTEASEYVEEAFIIYLEFEKLATEKEWSLEWVGQVEQQLVHRLVHFFLEHANKVLNSVQQTGSSLQRFKRKGISTSDSSSNVTVTDEYKIRLQLQLDTNEIRERAKRTSVSLRELDQLLNILQQSEA